MNAIKLRFESNGLIQSGLVDMYGKVFRAMEGHISLTAGGYGFEFYAEWVSH